MVRTPLRVVLATWTLVALIVTSVGPVVTAALGEPSGQRDDHACSPEAPLPCCAIGNANSQAPLGTPTVARPSAPGTVPMLAPSWSQFLAPGVDARLHAGVPLGPIPLVIRTSVLLI